MSYSTVVVFFIVLVGIYITHGGQLCAEDTGVCIPIPDLFHPPSVCSPLIGNYKPCPLINPKKPTHQPCCVDCQQKFINDACNDTFEGSVGQYYNNQTHCCPDMLEVLKPFTDSPCRCCQTCTPTRRCLRGKGKRKGFCVTRNNPMIGRSYDYCLERGWRPIEKWCKGDGCYCCFP